MNAPQTESSFLCKLRSNQSEQIGHRPTTHNKLDVIDDSFDYRLIANFKCRGKLTEYYKLVLYKCHESLLGQLEECLVDIFRVYNSTSDSERSNKFNTANITIINTCLSDSDRNFLINDIVLRYLEIEMRQLFIVRCDSHQTKSSSAYDIIKHVVEEFKYKWELLQSKDARKVARKKQKKSQEDSLLHLDPVLHLTHQFNSYSDNIPHEVIAALALNYKVNVESLTHALSSNDSSNNNELLDHEVDLALSLKPILVIVLESLESISDEVLADFILRLKSSSIRLHIIAFNSQHCAMPLYLRDSVSSMLRYQVLKSATPWDIYDQFIFQILTSKDFTVIFTAPVVSELHELFWRSQCCLYSIVMRLTSYFSKHFLCRRSLLCMFEDIPYIEESKIVPNYSASLKGTEKGHAMIIGKLIQYMGEKDIAMASGLILARLVTKNYDEEKLSAQTMILSNSYRSKVDKMLLMCLQFSRDTVMPPSVKALYCIDVLWIAILSSSSGVVASTTPSDGLLNHPQRATNIRSRTSLADFIVDFHEGLKDLPIYLMSHLLEKWKDLMVAFEVDEKYMSAYLSIQRRMIRQINDYMKLTENFSVGLQADNISPRLSHNQLLKLNHGDLSKPTLELQELIDLCRDDINRVDFTVPDVSLLEFLVGDIVDIFKGFVDQCLKLERPAELPGIMSFEREPIDGVQGDSMIGTLRTTTSRGWIHAEQFLKTHEHVPDSTVLVRIISKAMGSVAINDLFQQFKDNCSMWIQEPVVTKAAAAKATSSSSSSLSMNSSAGAEASSAAPGDDNDLLMRCRFFQALNDIERTGLAKIRRAKDGSLVLDRLIFTWIQDS